MKPRQHFKPVGIKLVGTETASGANWKKNLGPLVITLHSKINFNWNKMLIIKKYF